MLHATRSGPALAVSTLVALLGGSACVASEADLHVEIEGEGRVAGAAGIDCARDEARGQAGSCAIDSRETTFVTLDALPAPGATFVGWTYSVSNDCTGRCNETAPSETFTSSGSSAAFPLQAYPNHVHVRIVATFASR